MTDLSSEKKIPGQASINAIREGLININRIIARQRGTDVLVAELSQHLMALQNMLTNLERELATQESDRDELAALFNVSQAIGSSLDLRQVLTT